jgi:hypothetical protein
MFSIKSNYKKYIYIYIYIYVYGAQNLIFSVEFYTAQTTKSVKFVKLFVWG